MNIINNVTRLLDAKNIQFTTYQLPNEKLSAVEVGQFLDVSSTFVYKTIVAIRVVRGKPLLGLVPAGAELELKLLAKAIGEKKVRLATHQQAEQLTGLQTGGISPLALVNQGFQTIVDISAQSHQQIIISGGQRGLMVQLNPHDLVQLTNGKFADIAR